MIPHQTYIIETILVTGLFSLIYLLVLRNRPILVFNRFVLLGMVLLGVSLPSINFTLPQNTEIPTSSFFIDEVLVNAEYQQKTETVFFKVQYVYYIITLILLFYFLAQVMHLIRLHKESKQLNDKSVSYRIIDGKYPHFSFFNTIFINSELVEDNSELEMILEHELVHVKQLHSIDIILFEIVKIVFWFNPFIWLIKNLAVENHEYLADKGMLKKTSISTYDYFTELLQSTLFTYKLSVVNYFNHSLLKERIKMMTTQNLKLIERLLPLFIVPVFFFVTVFFSCSESQKATGEITDDKAQLLTSDGEALYLEVDVMPRFDGGDFNNFKRHIQNNLIYPADAANDRIMGTVYVQFAVGADGKVKDVDIIKGVSSSLDTEARRVIELSPDWTPAENNGKKVAVQIALPIKFMLQNEEWTVEDSRKEKAEAEKENLPDPVSGIMVVAY